MDADEIRSLAANPDILTLGMRADDLRREFRGTAVTYLRVAGVAVDKPLPAAIPASAREVRLTGRPADLKAAAAAAAAIRKIAGDRHVSGFSLADLSALAPDSLNATLRTLRVAGLDMVAEVPLDRVAHAEAGLDALESAGYRCARLTVDRAAGDERLDVLFRAQALVGQSRLVCTVSPLPMVLNAFRPTTGYEDVKMVALARLVLPARSPVQVDWQRYGPKLAQVALTFGADDVDNVPADDDAPDGPRRSTMADLVRNIEAAGFTPLEREGDFAGRGR